MPRAERDMGLMTMVINGADPINAALVKWAVAAAGSRRTGRRRPGSEGRLRSGADAAPYS